MLSRRARADTECVTATFICANAQTYPFEPERFDLIVSGFGVMVPRRIGRGTREREARRARRRRAANDRLARSGGQPVHDRRLGVATSVLPLPER